jgi:hypothetical protein
VLRVLGRRVGMVGRGFARGMSGDVRLTLELRAEAAGLSANEEGLAPGES